MATAVTALASVVGASGAGAALTSPTQDQVVRGGAVTLTEDLGGRAFTFAGTPVAPGATTCGSTSSTPAVTVVAHSLITVTAPGGAVVHSAVSPPRQVGVVLGFIPIYDRGGPWSTQWLIPEDSPAGVYTATTTTVDRKKTSASSLSTACANLAPVVTSSVQFEYRPFQHKFTDVLGNGSIGMNLIPAEFQITSGTQSGEIRPAGTDMTFFAVPGADSVGLPSDPNACAADPASCVPSAAVACDPSAGCVPRLVVVNHQSGRETLAGLFDLETKAFIAYASVNGNQRLLFSLGTDNDAVYDDVLAQLAAAAQAQGVDLLSLLATTARVRTESGDIELSVLQGLQIDAGPGAPAGVQILSDFTAQIGLVLHTYSFANVPNPTGQAGIQVAASPGRFTPRSGAGYTVEQSDLVPQLPTVVPVIAPGGPLYHVTARGGVGSHTGLLAAGTAADAPSGLPVWLPLADPAHTGADRTMDFVGNVGILVATELCSAATCSGTGIMLGLGAALFNNPLPVGLGDIPIWDPQSPEVVALMAQISQAIADASSTVLNDPAVQDVLGQLLGEVDLPI